MTFPAGIDTYIIKTVEWCNLNCSYCYFYNSQDTSFEKRPRFLPRRAIEAVVPKIIEHSLSHAVTEVHLVMHGGEPLLQPKTDYEWTMEQFDAIDKAGIVTLRKCTTNGVNLDDEWAQILAKWNTHLGISIDGTKEIHDSFRKDLGGKGSYDRVVKGLERALAWQDRGLHVGSISVLNANEQGAVTYKHLRNLGVTNINLVLPEANYINLMPSPPQDYSYLRLMTDIFDAWIAEDNSNVNIRLFQDVIRAVAGLPFASDQFGYAPINVAVLETDGSLQPTDNFRACANGMSELGISVYNDSIGALYDHPFFRLCDEQQKNVPQECNGCKFLDICGGGRITSRFDPVHQFARKSVHCDTLYGFFDHVKSVLSTRIPTGV